MAVLHQFGLAVVTARTLTIPLNVWTLGGIAVTTALIATRRRAVGVVRHIWAGAWNVLSRYVIARFESELAYRILARSYCRSILADESASSIRVPPSRRALPVGEIYVNLQLRLASDGRLIEDQPTRPRAVRIVGEPGSGKSTYLRYHLVKGCDLLLRPYGQRSSRLPVFVELARSSAFEFATAEECCDALLAEISANVDRRSLAHEKGVLDHFLRGRGVHVLLDGLDEVRQESMEIAANAVSLFMKRMSELGTRNRVYLTMREQCFRLTDPILGDEFATVGRFDSFSGNDIFDYLCRWPWSGDATIARSSPGVSDDRGRVQLHSVAIANRVFKLLESQPTLRRLCGNPLILAMYIATVEDDSSPVAASTKTEFFKLVADELLYDRRARPRGGDEDRRLALRSLRESIGRAAAGHLEEVDEAYNAIPVERFTEALSEFFGDPHDALLRIERDTGLIRFQGDSHVTFIHGTFLDYFAARWYANNNREPWLAPARLERRIERKELSSGRLDGVIAHGCSLAPRAGQDRALDYINEHLPPFLGSAFLETRRYDHPRLEEYIERELAAFSGVDLKTLRDRQERFALLVFILFDLLLNAEYFPTVTVDPARVAERLVGNVACDELDLLRQLLARDSSLALSLAFLVREDLSARLPELYVETCDDWYVASALISKVKLQEDAYSIPNCVMLAEASLRFPSVSYLLSSIHVNRETEYGWHFVKRHRRQTYEASGFRRSLLTVVWQRAATVQESTFADAVFDADLTRLRLVRSVRKPNRWWLGHRAAAVLRTSAVLAVPTALAAIALHPDLTIRPADGGDSIRAGVLLVLASMFVSSFSAGLAILVSVRIKLFRLIHRPYVDRDYLFPYGARSWGARITYAVTRFWYKDLADVVARLDREPFNALGGKAKGDLPRATKPSVG